MLSHYDSSLRDYTTQSCFSLDSHEGVDLLLVSDRRRNRRLVVLALVLRPRKLLLRVLVVRFHFQCVVQIVHGVFVTAEHFLHRNDHPTLT